MHNARLPLIPVEPSAEDPFPHIGHPKKRAFLIALAACGGVHRACDAAGIARGTHLSPAWRNDPAFMTAMQEAFGMAGELMEQEARRRAIEGVRQYQFTKTGDVIRHPRRCECGHDVTLHPRDPDDPLEGLRPCAHPDCVAEGGPACSTFVGEPYYEHEYSDTLLKFLLQGALPEKYSKKVELRGLFARLDMTKLPDPLVQRIADGENPMQVILEAANEAGTNPAAIMGLSEEVEGVDDEPPGMDEYEPPEGQL